MINATLGLTIFHLQVDWAMLINELFPKPLKMHETILVHDPVYLRKLGRIISLFGKRSVAKYAKNIHKYVHDGPG